MRPPRHPPHGRRPRDRHRQLPSGTVGALPDLRGGGLPEIRSGRAAGPRSSSAVGFADQVPLQAAEPLVPEVEVPGAGVLPRGVAPQPACSRVISIPSGDSWSRTYTSVRGFGSFMSATNGGGACQTNPRSRSGVRRVIEPTLSNAGRAREPQSELAPDLGRDDRRVAQPARELGGLRERREDHRDRQRYRHLDQDRVETLVGHGRRVAPGDFRVCPSPPGRSARPTVRAVRWRIASVRMPESAVRRRTQRVDQPW